MPIGMGMSVGGVTFFLERAKGGRGKGARKVASSSRKNGAPDERSPTGSKPGRDRRSLRTRRVGREVKEYQGNWLILYTQALTLTQRREIKTTKERMNSWREKTEMETRILFLPASHLALDVC